MGKTIAVYHQKGGVGKTTTCVNLVAALTQFKKKALLCDFDPQANGTSGLGVNKNSSPNIYDLVINGGETEKAIVHTSYGDVLPANKALSGAAIELVDLERREYRLKEALAQIKDKYDYILIDCPPQFGLLALNALCASDTVIIPVQCEYYALEGLGDFIPTLKMIKKSMNTELDIEGVLITMFDGRTNLSMQVTEEIKKYFRGKVYNSIIPRNVRLSEAPSHGKPVLAYDKTSKGSEAYMSLANELVRNNEKRRAK